METEEEEILLKGKKPKSRCIFKYDHPLKVAWNWIINICAIASGFYIPYSIGF